MKHKLQTLLKHKLQWLMLLAALLGVSQGVWGNKTLYLSPNDNWKTDNARFAVYYYNDGTSRNGWVSMSYDSSSSMYIADVDDSNYPNVIFCRMNPNSSDNTWNNKWNQTGNLTVSSGNCFTIPLGAWDGSDDSNWSTYTPSCTPPSNIYIKGPIHDDAECWPDYNRTPLTKSETTYSQTFSAYNNTSSSCGPKEFVLSTSTSDNDKLNDSNTFNGAGTNGWAYSTRTGETTNFNCTLDYQTGESLTLTVVYDEETCVYTMTIEKSCTTPTTSNFTVTSGTNTYVYNGSAHSATVTGVSPYTPSNIVAYYGINSSTTATSQTNAGTYNIYVHSADAYGSYCAVTSTIPTELATQLVISPVTPSSSNYSDLFSITGTGSHAYTGEAKSVAVAWKSPYTGCTGDITVKYDDSTDAPTNVGEYTITISVADGTNNNASEDDISVGTLTITAISPGLALGDISNKCGTGDYALSSTSNSAGAVTYSVTSGNATIVNGTTLRVNATGDVTVQASQVANGNYTAQVVSRTFTFAAAPVAGFSASADAETLEFSNTEYVSTTLRTDANSDWDFQWICDSHPTWGTNNTPEIMSSTSNSTEVRFPIEGVYTFHVGAKCKKDDSYISSRTVTVTVSLPLCIKGPLTESDGYWHSYSLISNISNSNTRTYSFTAFNKGTNIREFVLDASPSGDGDNHHIHTSSTVGNLTLTGLDYNSGNDYNLRALESLGISESGTRVVLTITHNGGLAYAISLALNCTTPERKTISINSASVCQGESVNVIVASSQSGYIYTLYDSNSSAVSSGTGTGDNLDISVTPSAGTTYTVKAKQADACLETSMANTVDISVNERPSFTPSTGITQYAPVTVTSTALTPSWSIASKDPDVDAAWISTTSGSSTVLKAPTGTYTVSDGGPCPTNAIVVSNDTEICN